MSDDMQRLPDDIPQFDDIRQLNEQGELAREQKQYGLALSFFDRALVAALSARSYAEAVNVLGHRLLVYKHLYDAFGEPGFMELLYTDAQAGLKLCESGNISGQPKSVMLLRSGDYFMSKREYSRAAKSYASSCDELLNSMPEPNGTYAEYLGFSAAALVKSGQIKQGFAAFDRALKILASPGELRPFHKLVIHSGVLMRKAEAHAETGDTDAARKALNEAQTICETLASEHSMPVRKERLAQLRAKLSL